MFLNEAFYKEVLVFKEIHFGVACEQDMFWFDCCATEKSRRVLDFGALKCLNF